MASENFSRALTAVLVHEGGYVNHPKDPGGATNKGVTQAVYDGFRRRASAKIQSVRGITDKEVRAIYKRQYWDFARCDALPAGVDYMVFDGAVNSGPSRSIRWLQSALGVSVDGMIGEETIGAAQAHPDRNALIARVCAIRMRFLRSLRTWPYFGRGWTSRVTGVEKLAKAIAAGSKDAQHTISTVKGANSPAVDKDIDRPTRKQESTADALMSGGTIGGALSGAASQLEPIKETSSVIMYLFIGLTLAGILALGVGLFLRHRNSLKSSRAEMALNSIVGA